jgi:hypothetical protein
MDGPDQDATRAAEFPGSAAWAALVTCHQLFRQAFDVAAKGGLLFDGADPPTGDDRRALADLCCKLLAVDDGDEALHGHLVPCDRCRGVRGKAPCPCCFGGVGWRQGGQATQ